MMSLVVVCYSCLFITEPDKSEQNGSFKWPSYFFCVFFVLVVSPFFLSHLDVDKGQEAGMASFFCFFFFFLVYFLFSLSHLDVD